MNSNSIPTFIGM